MARTSRPPGETSLYFRETFYVLIEINWFIPLSAFLSCRVTSASPEEPSVPHALSQFHLFAVTSGHSLPLSHLLRRRLGEGAGSPLLHSSAVIHRLLQMMSSASFPITGQQSFISNVKVFLTKKRLFKAHKGFILCLAVCKSFTWYKADFGILIP